MIRYAPDGREISRIQIPTSRVTSLTFAGADGRDLYITSARSAKDKSAVAGGLFRTRTNTCGAQIWRSNLAAQVGPYKNA